MRELLEEKDEGLTAFKEMEAAALRLQEDIIKRCAERDNLLERMSELEATVAEMNTRNEELEKMLCANPPHVLALLHTLACYSVPSIRPSCHLVYDLLSWIEIDGIKSVLDGLTSWTHDVFTTLAGTSISRRI